jgi:Rieske 2Fe-2S family protein
MPATAFTLPAKYYVDPELFEHEMRVFFRRMWVCIGRFSDLETYGSYLARHVAGASLLVVRTSKAGEPDQVRAFHNLCRHRGTALCAEEHGRFAGAIQCEYHAWTYDFDGRLIGAPHMDGAANFERENFPLLSVAADVWDGFIWVRLSDEGDTLRAQLADLPARFAPWRMGDLRRGDGITYDIKANWKLVIQNFSECLHCPNLHPALNKLSHYLSGENEPLRPTYMGGRMDLNDGVATMSMDGTCPRTLLPGLSPEDQRRVYYYAVFPNLLISAHPDYVMAHTLWPLAPNRTRLVCEWHFDPAELARSGFRLDDVREFWDMTNRQDWHVCELAQQGISSPAYRPGPYSAREDLLYAFDRFIVERLNRGPEVPKSRGPEVPGS